MSVGVEAIDNDHKKILSLISALHCVIEYNKPTDAIEAVFDELTSYAAVHFKREEDLMQASNFAERIRLSIEQLTIPIDKAEISVSVSIGVTEWNGSIFSNLDEMIQCAGKALYDAKNSGRNCVKTLQAI